MCIAIMKPAGITIPSWETLENCNLVNNDGAGFAIALGDRVRIQKGYLKFNDFKKALIDLQKSHDTTRQAMLLHFRIGTHGSRREPVHTHPFPLANCYEDMYNLEYECDSAVVHNGIIAKNIDEPVAAKITNALTRKYKDQWRSSDGTYYDYKTRTNFIEPDFDLKTFQEWWNSPNYGHSDTMDYIKNVLYPIIELGGYPINDKMTRLAQNIMGNSRIAILNKDGSFPVKWGTWIEDSGLSYSNSGFRGWNKTQTETKSLSTECNETTIPINADNQKKRGKNWRAGKNYVEFPLYDIEIYNTVSKSTVYSSFTPDADFLRRYYDYLAVYTSKDTKKSTLKGNETGLILWYLRHFYNSVEARESNYYDGLHKRIVHQSYKRSAGLLTFYHPADILNTDGTLIHLTKSEPVIYLYPGNKSITWYNPDSDSFGPKTAIKRVIWEIDTLTPAKALAVNFGLEIKVYKVDDYADDEMTAI